MYNRFKRKNMKLLKVILFLSLVTLTNSMYSQCQPVCVVGGLTVTPSGTQSVVVTNTVATTGNWLRGDSATKQQNKLVNTQYFGGTPTAQYLFSIDNGITVLGNFPFTRQDSLTHSMNQLLNGNGYLSVIRNRMTELVSAGSIFQSYGGNSYFRDTISGKNLAVANTTYSTSVSTAAINTKLAGTLTVTTTGTQTTVISGTPTVNVNNFPASQVVSGTVTVANPSVTVTGTPTVNISNTGSVTVTNTVAVSATQTTATLTPTYLRATASSLVTITAGAKLISIANVGTGNGNVNGIIIDPGESVTMPINNNDVYPAVTYDALGTTTLKILVLR